MGRKVIVSFANKNGVYVKNLARLSDSLRNNFDGDFIAFIGEKSCGAEPHLDNPYNFKIHCIQKAIDAGYEQVLWLDTSCFAVKNVQPIFDEIVKDGFIFQDIGFTLDQWCNDFALSYFSLTRQEAKDIKLIGNAGFLGIDFSKQKGHDFFNKWKESMEAGCFKGSWDNHRHDLSCSSAIIHQMGIANLMKSRDSWLQYAGIFDETLNDTIIIKAQG